MANWYDKTFQKTVRFLKDKGLYTQLPPRYYKHMYREMEGDASFSKVKNVLQRIVRSAATNSYIRSNSHKHKYGLFEIDIAVQGCMKEYNVYIGFV